MKTEDNSPNTMDILEKIEFAKKGLVISVGPTLYKWQNFNCYTNLMNVETANRGRYFSTNQVYTEKNNVARTDGRYELLEIILNVMKIDTGYYKRNDGDFCFMCAPTTSTIYINESESILKRHEDGEVLVDICIQACVKEEIKLIKSVTKSLCRRYHKSIYVNNKIEKYNKETFKEDTFKISYDQYSGLVLLLVTGMPNISEEGLLLGEEEMLKRRKDVARKLEEYYAKHMDGTETIFDRMLNWDVLREGTYSNIRRNIELLRINCPNRYLQLMDNYYKVLRLYTDAWLEEFQDALGEQEMLNMDDGDFNNTMKRFEDNIYSEVKMDEID